MTFEQSETPKLNEHEEAFIRSFIVKPRQERSMYLLNSRRRRDFTNKLEHERWIDMRFATHIPGSVAHTADELVNLLKKNGAGADVWVISENREIDNRRLPIEDAMKAIWGVSTTSVLSCVPGKLAFLRGEHMKSEMLLQHP